MKPRSNRTTAAQPTDAGLWLRVGAKFVDQALFGFMDTALLAVGAWLNALGRPAWMIAAAFVLSKALWYVYVFALTVRSGQTIGKRVAGTQVVTRDGVPPASARMARRLAVEFAFDMLPLVTMALAWIPAARSDLSPDIVGRCVVAGAAIGTLMGLANPLYILLSPRRQAIHDLVAGTYVVRTREVSRAVLVALAVICAALPEALVFTVVRPYVVEAYWVPSGSMEPTILIGDRILANKMTPWLRGVRDGDIIMFAPPEYVSKEKVFVKRAVGTAGDRLQVKDGKLFRNSLPLSEPYIKEPPDYTWPKDGAQVEVPTGQIVVMGDNRNNSEDSHLWDRVSADGHRVEAAPFLPVESVKGSLVYRYWPPDRMGTVTQER